MRPEHDRPSQRLLRYMNDLDEQDRADLRDPLSRLGGRLEIGCRIDTDSRTVTDAAAMATKFRGYETLLRQKHLLDAGLLSSTASGICGGVHATASSLCLEMALGVRPPPLGIVGRNLLLSCQYLNDNPMHLFVLSGPDYSASTFARTNPAIWSAAQATRARHADVHGFPTIAAVMSALERDSGQLCVEAIRMIQRARKAYTILGGKYPHSESIIPGGVRLNLGIDEISAYIDTLAPFADYALRSAKIWDDIFDFLYECEPKYLQIGANQPNFVDFGQWDHEEFYDARYLSCDEWGEKRWSTPGAVVDGKLLTTQMSELDQGLALTHDWSFQSPEPSASEDSGLKNPAGEPLSPEHPWRQRLLPIGHGADVKPGYSWASCLAWKQRRFEVGAYARLYISALANKLPASRFVQSRASELTFSFSGLRRETSDKELRWKVPSVWNALERNRARAYAIAYNLAIALESAERAKRLISRGETALSSTFEIPERGRYLGAGFCGAGRGFLAHWATIDEGQFTNYQIAVPSRINAGPRGPGGVPGPIESALMAMPIIESTPITDEEFSAVDIVRAIQSFDPCMSCQAHVQLGENGSFRAIPITTS